MRENLANLRSSVCIFFKQLRKQVFAAGTQPRRKDVRFKVEWLMADFAIARLSIIVPERRRCCQEHVQKASERPDVTTKAVGVSRDDLRGGIPRRPNFEGCSVGS